MSKKTKLIIGGIALGVVVGIVSIVNSDSFQTSSKIGEADRVLEQYKEETLESSVAIEELNRIKDNSDIEEVKTYVKDLMSEVTKLNSERSLIDEVKDKMYNNEITDVGYGVDDKSKYVKLIKDKISEDSVVYEEAQEVLEQLDSYEQEYINVTYTKQKTTAGLQKVRIKIENESGKDIAYIRLDFFEISNSGNTVGSDWTNNSSIIKDGSSIYIETYYDFVGSESKLEFEISDIRYR